MYDFALAAADVDDAPPVEVEQFLGDFRVGDQPNLPLPGHCSRALSGQMESI